MFNVFTILAVFVACLGLLGLSSFTINLRKREVGTRKVLGATVSGIIILFSKDFVKLVALATVTAVPLIYFLANRGLMNYAFHTHLGWYNFLLPPLLLLLITLLMVAIQSIRTAITNPVESIRSE